jgi:hypothetical protein
LQKRLRLTGLRVLRIAGIEWQSPKICIAVGFELTVSQPPPVGGKTARPGIVLALQEHLRLTRSIRTDPIQPGSIRAVRLEHQVLSIWRPNAAIVLPTAGSETGQHVTLPVVDKDVVAARIHS